MVTRRQMGGWRCGLKVFPANNIIKKSGCSHRNKCMNISIFIYIFCFCCCILPVFWASCILPFSWELSGKAHHWFTCNLALWLIIHSLLSRKNDGKVQMASRVREHMDFEKKWSFILSSSSGKTFWSCGTMIIMMMVILMTPYFDALWFVKCFSFTLFLTLGIKSCMWLDSFDS